MSKDKLFLPILLGTTRNGRESENAAKWLFGKMGEREEIETHLFDILPTKHTPTLKNQILENQLSDFKTCRTISRNAV